jgi:hypothetical protein
VEKALARWWEARQVLRGRFAPEMRRIDQTASVFHGSLPLESWLREFVNEVEVEARNQPALAERGVELVCQILTQFPDEDREFRDDLRGELGHLQVSAGRPDEGEATLRQLIADAPGRAVGYERLADLLELRAKNDPVELAKAAAVLAEAVDRPVDDMLECDLEFRLEDLRTRIHELEAGAEVQAGEAPL